MSTIDRKRLKTMVPFGDLSDTHLDDILNKSTVENHAPGKILFKRGEETKLCHFLLDGAVDLADAEFEIHTVEAGSERALSALDNHQPHVTTGVTTSEVSTLTVSKDYIDLVLTWNEAGSYVVEEVNHETPGDDDWMFCLLQSHIFTTIPPANIQQLFGKFEEVLVEANDVIIKQGDAGDYFYVVKSGTATIVRRVSSGGGVKDQVLATVNAGDVFGEDALIGNAPRNASVVMTTPGALMRLGQEDFESLLQDPVLDFIEFDTFKTMVEDPSERVDLLDVRLPLEYKGGHIPAASNLPLHAIRQNIDKLNRDITYVTSCDGGRRSTLAAYLLSEAGFHAVVLKNPPEIVDA